ncbi:hypothetical protein ACFQ0D_14455, partial [Micromonospora zhanjiangensis]
MPLVAAAVCPHPPLLVPEIAGAAAPELDDLRTACDAAVDRLWESGARRLVVVGGDRVTREHYFPFVGTFAPWGAPVQVGLGADSAAVDPADVPPIGDRPALPLSLLVGTWLLRRRVDRWRAAGRSGHPVTYQMVGLADDGPDGPLGGPADGGPWAMLVLGDG